MIKGFSFFLSAILLVAIIVTSPSNANAAQTLVTQPTFEAEKVSVGKLTTITVTTDEGTMVVTQDNVSKRFLALKTDFLDSSEEAKQLKLLQKTKVTESATSGMIGTTTSVAQTSTTYNKWHYGKWRNYTVTFEKKATVSIIFVGIVSAIPYVGRVAGPAAALMVLWHMKVGHFSAKRDYKFLTGVNMMERQHLKTWKNSNYTHLLEYTMDEKKTRGR